jgi:type I restriction enzyme S subunit
MVEKLSRGYKKTEIGIIPESWEVKSIGDITVEHKQGYYTEEQYTNQGCYLIRITDLNNPRIDFEDMPKVRVSDTTYKQYEVIEGDFLFARSGAIGRYGIFEKNYPCSIFASYLIRFRFNKEMANMYFIGHFYSSNYSVSQLNAITQGSTNININAENIKAIKIPIPPLLEQTGIANALTDMDNLISSIERLIAKKQIIKQGVMQELLTGKIRLNGLDKGLTAPNGYKKTEVGEIPTEWGVEKLGNMTLLMTNGFVGTIKEHYSEYGEGVIYIQGYNVEENSFNFNGIKRVTSEFHRKHAKSCLQEDDLLTVQTGDVGLTTIVPKELEGSNCHALIITRFLKDKYKAKFYSYYLNSPIGRRRLKDIETGTTMKHINVGEMIHFLVPVPPLTEQNAIVEILSAMDEEIEKLASKNSKYKAIKQGMMQELLTGKRRLV